MTKVIMLCTLAHHGFQHEYMGKCYVPTGYHGLMTGDGILLFAQMIAKTDSFEQYEDYISKNCLLHKYIQHFVNYALEKSIVWDCLDHNVNTNRYCHMAKCGTKYMDQTIMYVLHIHNYVLK